MKKNINWLVQRLTEVLKKWWPLLLIFALALLLRVVKLGGLPAGFYEDEILSGYLGRFLWQNGMDLYGNRWPLLYFNKFGDYYIILPMYLDGLSTYLFGVTEFATRLPTALLGALSIFPLAGIANLLWQRKRPVLLAALLLAILPWHVVLSRATTESVIEMFLVLVGLWFVLVAIKSKNLGQWFCGVLVLLFSYLIYHTARIYGPLLIMGVGLIWSQELWRAKKWLVIIIGSLGLLLGVTGYIGTTDWGRGRFGQTSILGEQSGVMIRITELTYNLGPNSAKLARVFHNKLVGYGREFLYQYGQYFSPQYLFFNGWQKSRYTVPEAGPVLLTIGLLLVSLLFTKNLGVKTEKKSWWLLIWLWLVAAVPAATTVLESPNVRRSLFMAVPIVLTAGLAWDRLFEIRKAKIMGYLVALLILVESIFVYFYYYHHFDITTALYRSDGLSQSASYVVNNREKYQKVFVANRTTWPIYYLFYKRDFAAHWASDFQFGLKIQKMDNVIPVDADCLGTDASVTQQLTTQDILVEKIECVVDFTKYKEIYRITGTSPFLGYRVIQLIPTPSVSAPTKN